MTIAHFCRWISDTKKDLYSTSITIRYSVKRAKPVFYLIVFYYFSSRVNDENRWMDTPERSGVAGSKSARKMFGSIERGLDRVRLMLTPRRRQLQRGLGETEFASNGPNVVDNKTLYNVSTTSSRDPDFVLSELRRALQSKGIPVKQKGYTLRGRITEGVRAKLSFELEVCLIPRVDVVGIRRKRLKGDAWCYKRVCEEVLRMASIQTSA